MKANTKNKKNKSPMRKLLPAAGSLMISAAMLSTSTYAWFTMNKEVSVTGMELKAHSEEGLLINEVKLATSSTWDDAAQAAATATGFELRPASTSDLATWWHANSKKSSDEAGVDATGDTVVVDSATNAIYTNISSISDYVDIGDENSTVTGTNGQATGNTQAETHVYYTDASYGTAGSYQNGEGYYVKYTYYLKSSGQADLSVSALKAQVKATLKEGGSAAALDNSLRVGIKYGSTGMKIFAPVKNTVNSPNGTTTTGPNTSYGVTNVATGATSDTVTPVVASATGTPTAYTAINTSTETIPSVTTNGAPVYVYVWFEGEDTNCMSDNLTASLNAYDIDINFKVDEIGGSGAAAPASP
jgi:hypothetical protein